MSWLLSALVGAATGVLSGFGVGGGTLLLLWLTLGRVPEKEETPLLRTLKMCTSRDAVRFPDKELREILLRMCGCESEKYTEIGWLYREYCMQWPSMVGFSPSFERSALTRRT